MRASGSSPWASASCTIAARRIATPSRITWRRWRSWPRCPTGTRSWSGSARCARTRPSCCCAPTATCGGPADLGLAADRRPGTSPGAANRLSGSAHASALVPLVLEPVLPCPVGLRGGRPRGKRVLEASEVPDGVHEVALELLERPQRVAVETVGLLLGEDRVRRIGVHRRRRGLSGHRGVRVAGLVVAEIELFALDASVSGDLLRGLRGLGACEHTA